MAYNEVKLSDVAEYISRGITPSYTEETGTIVINQKCVRGGGVSLEESRYHNTAKKKVPADKFLRKWDILVNSTGTGTLGRVGQIVCDIPQATVDSHVTIVRPSGIIDPAYLGYALKWRQPYIEALAEGSTGQTELSRFRLGDEITIPLPSLETQKIISQVLTAIDGKITVNKKINDNLQQQASALYKSWFVVFSSVSNSEMLDSQIGKIPYGWRIYKLSEFLPVITGKKNANVSSDKGDYPFFSCSQDFAWTDDYSFEGHAILVAGNGDFNVKWYRGKFEAYQRTYVLIPYEERFTSWLYYAVKYNLAKITSAARGSVIKFITKGNLEDFSFAAPADLSSCTIIDTFATINRKIDALTQENYRLAAMRDILLPRLMSGEVDVSDIDI